ncbi:MAG: BMP family lipoprotein [Capsulimonadaceae bacterium]
MQFRLLPALSLLGLAFVSGCSSREAAAPATSTPPAVSTTAGAPAAAFKVALLTTGPVTDGGWNESAYDGLLKIHKDLGATIDKQENLKDDQFVDAFRDFANRGFNLIIGHGDEFGDAAAQVAAQYPNVDFVTTGGEKSAPNLMPVHFATEEGNYLQGMEAALVSKSGKGGFVGGQELPPVKQAAEAFAKGALAVNPKFQFTATYINSWTDPAAAKTQTLTLLGNGCDVISHNCDAAAKGMFDTAGTRPGVYTFGVNANENSKAPNVLSSAVLDIPKAFDDIAKEVKAGTFKGGPISLGMQAGDVTLVDNPRLANAIPASGRAKIQAAKAQIVAGKIAL